tara:strand:- start:709 stop:1098 length:390 start_codon:yes stop_codon:yes gene_type:complete
MKKNHGTSLVEVIFASVITLLMILPISLLLSGGGGTASATREGTNRTVQILLLVDRLFGEPDNIPSIKNDDNFRVELVERNQFKSTVRFISEWKNGAGNKNVRKTKIEFERTACLPESSLIADYEFNRE